MALAETSASVRVAAQTKPTAAPGKLHAQTAAQKEAAARHARMMLLAPADEYFGPLKQSILGIGNTIRDLGLHYEVNHDIGPQTIASAALTERAIHDWQAKYPHDHGVAQAIFRLQRLYARISTEQGHLKAQATAMWLFTSYGSSQPAIELHKLIADEALTTPAASATSQGAVMPPLAPDMLPNAPPIINPLPSPTARPAR